MDLCGTGSKSLPLEVAYMIITTCQKLELTNYDGTVVVGLLTSSRIIYFPVVQKVAIGLAAMDTKENE